MFFLTSLGRIKLTLGTFLLFFATISFSQSLESVAFSLTLPDGQTGGIKQRSTITNLVQRPEGLYVLTERDGCYLLSNKPDEPHTSLAQPVDRRQKFNRLLKKGKEVHLVVNYQSFLSLSKRNAKPFSFTSSFFAKTVHPTSIHFTEHGQIIVGTMQDGLFIFSPDEFGGYSNVPERVSTAGSLLPSNVVHTIYEDSKGVIWVGTERGMATITQNTVHNLGTPPPVKRNWWQRFWGTEGPKPVYDGPVKAIAEWGDSIVFAGEEQLFRIPSRPDSLAMIYDYDINARLPEPMTEIKQLLVDLNGDVWIAANQLLRYNITRDELQVIGHSAGLRGTGVSALIEDPAMGQIWIGTERGGLYRLSNDPYSRIGH